MSYGIHLMMGVDQSGESIHYGVHIWCGDCHHGTPCIDLGTGWVKHDGGSIPDRFLAGDTEINVITLEDCGIAHDEVAKPRELYWTEEGNNILFWRIAVKNTNEAVEPVKEGATECEHSRIRNRYDDDKGWLCEITCQDCGMVRKLGDWEAAEETYTVGQLVDIVADGGIYKITAIGSRLIALVSKDGMTGFGSLFAPDDVNRIRKDELAEHIGQFWRLVK